MIGGNGMGNSWFIICTVHCAGDTTTDGLTVCFTCMVQANKKCHVLSYPDSLTRTTKCQRIPTKTTYAVRN